MFPQIDFYKILQVDEKAHPDVVRAAYRVLARAYHPDVEGGSVEKMVALNNAWAVISDENKRAAYDQTRAGFTGRDAPEASARESVHVASPPASAPRTRGRTRSAQANPSTVLDFGRYQGWTLEQVARQDPDFLEWLSRMPIGRPYRAEIDALLAVSRVAPKQAANGNAAGRRTSAWKFRR